MRVVGVGTDSGEVGQGACQLAGLLSTYAFDVGLELEAGLVGPPPGDPFGVLARVGARTSGRSPDLLIVDRQTARRGEVAEIAERVAIVPENCGVILQSPADAAQVVTGGGGLTCAGARSDAQ